jgi:hypothetical protein
MEQKPVAGKTVLAGYGKQHRKLRAILIKGFRDGDLCAKCGLPMHPPVSMLDLGHNDERTAWTGLEHRNCNRADGAHKAHVSRWAKPGSRRAAALSTFGRKLSPGRKW